MLNMLLGWLRTRTCLKRALAFPDYKRTRSGRPRRGYVTDDYCYSYFPPNFSLMQIYSVPPHLLQGGRMNGLAPPCPTRMHHPHNRRTNFLTNIRGYFQGLYA